MICPASRSKAATAWVFAALLTTTVPSFAAVVAYTDRATFIAAIGGATVADDFESYAPGAIANAATLGNFTYSFSSAVQPAVVPGGDGGQALGGPFDVFVGGDAVSLLSAGATGLRAFGLSVLYAPSFDTIAAGVYRIQIGDGSGAGAFASNAALDSAGGRFFLGLVADASAEFRQVNLLSIVPLDANGDPTLVPAYQLDDFIYAQTQAVPEPATLALVLTASTLLAGLRRVR